MENKMMRVDSVSSAGSAQPPEDTLAGSGSGPSASAGLDKAFVISAANILQGLISMLHLIREDADDADKVRMYAKLGEEKLRALRDLMRPLLWNPT